ncbi:MAG TPA: rod-binding protein [Candidatus Baltobacteraceae bacterium]|jgi:Rod binding domain-containing protein|nr:rod-binding protein [Candidatus Baltobacteraceae bacterium]
MSDLSKIGAQQAAPAQPLTDVQKQALARLHDAATQLEGVFLQMVMSAMNDTVPKDSIFGKESASEETWQSMLSDERSQAIAKSGSIGIGKILEQQMRNQVLGDAQQEAHVEVDRRIDP